MGGNGLVWAHYVDPAPMLEAVADLLDRYPTRFVASAHGNVIDDCGIGRPVSVTWRPMDQAPVAQLPETGITPSRCPVAHSAPPPATSDGKCPFPHHAAAGGVQRSRADMAVRRILRIRERPAGVSAASAYSAFQRSMLISAIRCTLTYVVFPFVVPAVGFATGVGPVIGIVIGVVAMTCDVFTIRRFFSVDHRWRWHFSAIALCVIGLLSVLLVQDVVHLLT